MVTNSKSKQLFSLVNLVAANVRCAGIRIKDSSHRAKHGGYKFFKHIKDCQIIFTCATLWCPSICHKSVFY